jgi:hypothetical protein
MGCGGGRSLIAVFYIMFRSPISTLDSSRCSFLHAVRAVLPGVEHRSSRPVVSFQRQRPRSVDSRPATSRQETSRVRDACEEESCALFKANHNSASARNYQHYRTQNANRSPPNTPKEPTCHIMRIGCAHYTLLAIVSHCQRARTTARPPL